MKYNPFQWRFDTLYLVHKGHRIPVCMTYSRISPTRAAVKVGSIVALILSALAVILAFRG